MIKILIFTLISFSTLAQSYYKPSVLFSSPTNPPPPPATVQASFVSATSHGHANVSTRQTNLEPSTAGVDVSYSWSAWVLPHNIVTASERIFGVGLVTNSNLQYALSINPSNISTVNQVWNFVLFTTGANNIGVSSAVKALKGRATHIAITYDGSETAAGLNMYINGVLQASQVHTTNGTYTGALNDSGNRLFYSGVNSSATRYGGGMCNLTLWRSHVMSGSEVLEAYNGGIPPTLTSLSYYASFTATYPLRTDLVCLQNASFTLANDVNLSFTNQRFDSSWPGFTIVNGNPSTTAYLAFGSAFDAAGSIKWQGRSGTTHLLNGKIIQTTFTPSSITAQKSLSDPADILTNTDDLRGGNAGIIDGSVFNFTSSFDGTNSLELIRNESTDGFVGLTYGANNNMTVTYNRFTPYGKICPGFTAGETWIPWYESDLTTYRVNLYKRDNAGVYTTQTLFTDTSLKLTETALINGSGGRSIAVSRSDAVGGGLYLMYSTNSGSTWSSPVDTNLSVGTAMADMCLDPYGKVIIVWADRSDGYVRISVGNDIADLISDPTDWNTPSIIMEGYTTDSTNILCYPSIIRNGWFYTLIFSMEFSSSRADLFVGYGYLH